jgi:protein required for attachment to host cells
MTTRHSINKTKSIKPASKRKSSQSGNADLILRHWIVVAHHRQAHVYQKTPTGVERIPEECLHCSLPAPSGEQDDELFLQDLAVWLAEAVEEEAFDRIAIIADPQALKFLHPLLDKKVHARVCAAMPKDVQKITEDEIEDHLTEVIWL